MKRILLFLLLFSAAIQAQVVNIPNANFRSLLLTGSGNYAVDSNGQPMIIDVNNDDQIQVIEAEAVWGLDLSGTSVNITSLQGIQSFVNLRYLIIPYLNITVLDITALAHLEELDCRNSKLTSLNLSGLSSLKTVDCSGGSGLVYINTLNLSGMPALETLRCNGHKIVSLDLSGKPNLREFSCNGNEITSLDLSELSGLEYLECEYNHLVQLDITGSPLIKELRCFDNAISEIIIGDKEYLEVLRCDENELHEMVLGVMPNLKKIHCSKNQVEVIDVSGCPALNELFAYSNPLRYINMKNGDTGLNTLQILQGTNLIDQLYICVDEGEETDILGWLGTPATAYIDYYMSTYCTFTPGGDYNVITGALLFDNEGDGCDTNDTVISNIKLNINDGAESGSTISGTGLYNFYTQAGSYTITLDFENDHFTITPPFAEINFTEVDSLVTTQNFCLTPNGSHPDLDIVIVPFGARPGFDADYKIIYRNKGNQTLSGHIVFNYEEDVLDFVSANPSEDSSSSGTLTWNYTNLAPFQQREIFVTLNVNGPMETPAVNIEDNLQFTATINPITGDDTPLDNAFVLKETVVGSFDPNDITCLEGDSVNPDRIGEYLHYNINFENTGTAPATFIVVKDVIDTTQFDMATLQMLNASHPVQAKITGNKVEFRFDDINLGPEGKGNVVFKIKTLNTLQTNDDVTQQADIFFDYNWPIQTNEATTVFEVLSRSEFARDNSVKVYPNPSNGMVNITAASEIRSVELYDIQGRLLQAGSSASLDISGRAAGMYFVKVLTEAGMKVEKVVKK